MSKGFRGPACVEFEKIRWKISCAKWISSVPVAVRYYRGNLAEMEHEKPVTPFLEEPLCS